MRWDKLEGAPRKKINIVTELAILWLLVSVRCEGTGDVAPQPLIFLLMGHFPADAIKNAANNIVCEKMQG